MCTGIFPNTHPLYDQLVPETSLEYHFCMFLGQEIHLHDNFLLPGMRRDICVSLDQARPFPCCFMAKGPPFGPGSTSLLQSGGGSHAPVGVCVRGRQESGHLSSSPSPPSATPPRAPLRSLKP